MARVNFQGSNIGDGDFREIQISDNSEQVAKRNQRYIEDLKTQRDAQTAVDSQYIIDAERALRGEETSREKEAQRQLTAARTIANQQIKSLQAQAKEIESITGRRANITGKDEPKVDSWLEFVTNTSKKAAEMYQGVQQAENAFQWDQGIAKAHMFGATWDDVAWNRRWADSGIIGASKDQLAAMAEANGADPTYVEMLRSGNKHFANATKHALAKDMLKASTDVFQQELINNGEKTVDIRDPNGESRTIPLNQIDRANAAEVQQAYYQWLPDHIRQQGFGDASSEFLNAGLQEAKQGYDQLIGQIRSNEISRSKKERMEGAAAIFKTDQTPIAFKGVVVSLQNNDPRLTSNEAHEKAINSMADLSDFPDQSAVDSILDNTIVAGGASLRQAYAGAVQEMQAQRVTNLNNQFAESEARRESEENGRIEQLYAARDADYADDGQVNQINNEWLEQRAVEAEQRGFTQEAKVARSLKSQTVDGMQQKAMTDQWDTILAEGGYLDPRMVLKSGVDDATQAKYIKLANQSIQTAVPEDALQSFKRIAEKRLKLQVKKDYTKDEVMHESVDFALEVAMQEFQNDYVTALKSGKTNAEAMQYARQAFYDELKDEKGRYAVAELKVGRAPYPQHMPLYGKSFKPVDDVTAEFSSTFKAEGNAAYRIPQESLRPGIEASLTKLNNRGTFNYPLAINKMAMMSGGAYSPLDVYRMQAEALGIELPPAFEQAEEVELSVGPEYKKYLSYKPSPIRTDIAVISTGEDPIYSKVIPPAVAEDKAFQAEVSAVAKRLGISANDLYAVMGFETGGTFNPGIRNAAGSGATGLIQFMASTAKGLGTSTDALSRMSRVEQMQYVEKYLSNKGIRGGSLSDIYMAVLFPAAVGKGDDFVLFGRGAMAGYEGRAYDQNRGLDLDGSGSVTKAEAASKVFNYRDKYNAANPWRDPRNMTPAVAKYQSEVN
tara:strand:- start:518 stop:3370 length:2853 start_codon:yes stop_codon:yes gene_type:complete